MCSNLYVNVTILMCNSFLKNSEGQSTIEKENFLYPIETHIQTQLHIYINIHASWKANVNSLSYCYCTFDHNDYVFFIKMQFSLISK